MPHSDLGVIYEFAYKIFLSLCLLLIGKIIVNRFAKNFSEYLFKKLKIEATMTNFLQKIIHYGIWIIILTAILQQFGVQTTSILTILGAASVAIGLALQGTLSNIASGLVILALRPFKVGDSIQVDNISGSVESVGFFTTEIKTNDGLAIFCPNSKIWGYPITNFNKNSTRRLNMFFNVSYDSSVELAKQKILDYVLEQKEILQDPQLQIYVHTLEENGVKLNLRAWVQKDDYWAVYFRIQENIIRIFQLENIKFAYPQREVHLYEH